MTNLNPQEGHIIRKDAPERSIYVYMYRKWGGGGYFTKLESRYIQKTFVFIPFLLNASSIFEKSANFILLVVYI